MIKYEKKINLLTPFYRDQNFHDIIKFLSKVKENVRWVPLCASEKEPIFESMLSGVGSLRDIIHPFYAGFDSSYNTHTIDSASSPAFTKLNTFINTHIKQFPHRDDDYFTVMMDDDLYENNVFSEIVKHTEEVVFISMKRGDHIPEDNQMRHGTSTLFATPDSLIANNAGLQQAFMRANIIKNIRFANHHLSDGIVVEHLKHNHQYVLRPDLYSLFNYLQPGRYTDKVKYLIDF